MKVMRSSTRMVFAVTLALLLSGCAHQRADLDDYKNRGGCGSPGQDKAGWVYVKEMPAEREVLRSLAEASPAMAPGRRHYAVESWFAGSDGQLMICRTSAAPKDACVTAWWAFHKVDNEWKIYDQGLLVCVTG